MFVMSPKTNATCGTDGTTASLERQRDILETFFGDLTFENCQKTRSCKNVASKELLQMFKEIWLHKDSDEHWTDQNGWINSKSYCSLLPLESDESRIFSANGKPWFGWIDQSDHLMNFLSMFLKKSNTEKECNQCITIKAKEIKSLDSHWTADLYVDLISKTSSITHSRHTELISVNNAKHRKNCETALFNVWIVENVF